MNLGTIPGRAVLPTALLILAVPALADRVRLKSGGILEGRIVEERARGILLQSSSGILEIDRAAIQEILRTTEDAPPPPPREPEAPPPPPRKIPSPSPSSELDPALVSGIRSAMAAFTSMKESEEAFAAARSIAALGAPAVPALVEIARDADPVQRRWLAEAAGGIPDPSSVALFLELLRDRTGEVRGAVARALPNCRDPRAVDLVCGLLKDEDWSVRRDAVLAIQSLHAKNRKAKVRIAVPGLIERLSDSNLFVRGAAHDALKAITGQDLSSNVRAWKTWARTQPPFIPGK